MTSEGTVRLTVGQAVVRFLAQQRTERDGVEHRLFAGCFGIFGHGNVPGIGQALLEDEPTSRVHCATTRPATSRAWCTPPSAFARMRNRLHDLACTASVGPGVDQHGHRGRAGHDQPAAGAAAARRRVRHPGRRSRCCRSWRSRQRGDVSVNDAFRPVSRFFDRVRRPEQLPAALLGAMRVLTDPAETGAVTLALPQDVQAEAYDWPVELFARAGVARAAGPSPNRRALARAVELIRAARRPLVVAGGGVIYSEATDALRALAEATGIPVAETQAGKGSLPLRPPASLGASRGHRHHGRQRARPRGRPGDRRRHPLQRLHHRVPHRLRRTRTCGSSTSTSPRSTPPSTPALALVADAREALEALADALAGWQVDRRVPGSGPRRWPRSGTRRWSAAYTPRARAAARPVGGDRRGQRGVRPARRGGLRRRLDAGRPAQAVADARPEGLPRRVRLLLHGLRDRRRPRRPDGRPGPRGLRHGRRRLLPDDGAGAGDRGPGGRQAHRRAGAEPRLRLHRRPLRGGRLAAVRHVATATATRQRAAGRRRPAGRPGGQRGQPRRRRAAGRRAWTSCGPRWGGPAGARGPVLVHVETDPLVPSPDSESWWDVPVAEVSTLASTAAARTDYEKRRSAQRPYL